MNAPKIDIYFLIFASIILFSALIFFIVSFFGHYRRKQRKNFQEKEEMKNIFQKELLQTQLEIQEQTFNNISQEIHDNVGQILSLAKVQINIMNESETMSREMLNEVKENVGKAMSDLRDIAKSLSTERIRSLSIHATVMNEAERINKSGISNITIVKEGEEQEMNEQKKLILFRIIQESLQNSIKHANATIISISFQYGTHEVLVSIKDNGKGFNMEEAMQKNGGLGLLNIKTRASLTGGSSSIESSPDDGTTIKISIPYE